MPSTWVRNPKHGLKMNSLEVESVVVFCGWLVRLEWLSKTDMANLALFVVVLTLENVSLFCLELQKGTQYQCKHNIKLNAKTYENDIH